MAMNHLPPQAYTAETVSKAYAWLRTQPDSIKELARSVEILVGLYLKAQRHGDQSLQRPSLQNFKNELKSIQNLMGEFEFEGEKQVPKSGAEPVVANQEPAKSPSSARFQQPQSQQPQQPPQQQYSQQQSARDRKHEETRSEPAHSPHPGMASSSPSGSSESLQLLALREMLDSKSWTMVQEVKLAFNLSSETEALRLLISIGYQRAKKLNSN